ncbi:hypothetical protein Rain11_1589 [Raineya orbicola]|uniref:Uncharacterized protein n=1 Tax=Raineya orbicola TaxID=2016530 RepID=A0A2N3IE75_9BACT|nr:hypothetical protein Rain11_1589 [Raineya orbicola]
MNYLNLNFFNLEKFFKILYLLLLLVLYKNKKIV